MAVSAVIYGKHPAYGDFLAHGLPHAQLHVFDLWLEGVLPRLRDALGEGWEEVWRTAPVLRFWLGPGIIGAPVAGIFVASRDKVGRRYPLVFGLSGVVSPPPVHPAFDAAPYDALLRHLRDFDPPAGGVRGAALLVEGWSPPDLRGVDPSDGADGILWASRADGDLAKLFADAHDMDADKAQLCRSHWWHPAMADRTAGWLAVNGLPDVDALRWLMTDEGRSAGRGSHDVRSADHV